MAKTKTPFFSLGSTGSIGGSITTQKRGSSTMLRSKPTPAYRNTLLQQYQRWLYEDYAYHWTQQTVAVKRQYAQLGSRHHLTGLQYWMKVMLSTTPDIPLMLHLDEKAGAIAYDASKNKNNGIIYGASSVGGNISTALNFDGLNNYLSFPDTQSLFFTGALTFEAFIRPTQLAANKVIIGRDGNRLGDFVVAIIDTSGHLRFVRWKGIAATFDYWTTSTLACTINTWAYVAVVFNGIAPTFYLNNQSETPPKLSSTFARTNSNLRIARWDIYYFAGDIDELHLLPRALDQTEITRHSLRRYPL